MTNNLRAMGVDVVAVGVVGDDGEGFELLRGLDATGVDVDGLVIRADRFTPTYTKPMLRVRGGAHARAEPAGHQEPRAAAGDAEDQIIKALRGLLPQVHGVIIADQVQEEDFGVITERVRDELAALAHTYGEVPFVADSRERIGLFENVLIKPNAREAMRAVDRERDMAGRSGPDWALDRELIESAGERLYRRNGQPVFLTVARTASWHSTRTVPRLFPPFASSGSDRHRRRRRFGDGGDSLRPVRGRIRAGSRGDRLPGGGRTRSRQIGTTGTASRKQILD